MKTWTTPGRWALAAALLLALGLAGCASPPRSVGATGRDGPPTSAAAPDPRLAAPVEPKVEPIRAGGPNKPYEVLGQTYVPQTSDAPLVERGLASWYGNKFHGRRTASGETYNMHAMTAAHKTMPIPSYARVRNPANGREVIVRINDRGPFVAGRIIDLSWAAAVQLGVQHGLRPVEVSRITHEEIRAGLAQPRPAEPAVAAAAPEPAPVRSAVPPSAPAAWPGAVSTAAVTVPASPPAAPPAATPPGDAATGEGAPPARARALTAAASGFWLQLGAFARNEGAVSFQQRVAQELDWLAPLLAIFSEGGLHRLQAGPYPSREQAREAAVRVRETLQLVPALVERR